MDAASSMIAALGVLGLAEGETETPLGELAGEIRGSFRVFRVFRG
jgi:hypothetical protein